MKNISIVFTIFILIVSSCSIEPPKMVREIHEIELAVEDASEYIVHSVEEELQDGNQDQYNEIKENNFKRTKDTPISTFSIDADGASYSNMRRYILNENQLPPSGAVRTEELLNYFDLDYPNDNPNHPITLNGEVSECPWNKTNKLVRIGIKGKQLKDKPASNFVFLIDVSGSMASEDKLDLLKNGFKYFVDQMSKNDRVSIVTYAGADELILKSTSGKEKKKIKRAIDRLGSSGRTAGAAGIVTAYEIAEENFIKNGNNRIIIGTDGDFNVGPTSQTDLVKLIESKRDKGIFITVLGVGRGNLNDAMLEQIADNGNGTYEYIDHIEQLKKVFVYDYNKFFTVAKDVKVQVKFDPTNVKSYRLIGYENRLLKSEDFKDDKKDAGEIGANQNITALYEIVPNEKSQITVPIFTIDFRYKLPDSDVSQPMDLQVFDEDKSFAQASDFMKLTASLASFSMLLSDSEYKGSSSYDNILEWMSGMKLRDEHGYKKEFRSIVLSTRDNL